MNDKNYLVHYGILGQQWGVRNGPPYPLDSSDMSSNERKHFNIRAKDVKKNMDYMSDKELREAINRINMQEEVKRLSPGVVEKGKKAVMDDIKKFSTTVLAIEGAITAIKKISDWLK